MNTFVVRPILNLFLLFYQGLGQETILAIVVLTLIFRLALTPLARKQHISQQEALRKKQALQSNIAALQEKYKDNRSKLAEEQFKLYQEVNSTPTGSCLLLLIQFPILIGVYRAIISALAVTPIRLLALPGQIYPWAANLSIAIPLNSRFLWLDLALRDPYFILPILVFTTSWFRQKCSTPATSTPREKGLGSYLHIALPLLVAFLAAGYASGLAIYLLISNLIGIAEYYLFRRHYVTLTEALQDNKAHAEVCPPTTGTDTPEHDFNTVDDV